jgi:hypothetical protein
VQSALVAVGALNPVRGPLSEVLPFAKAGGGRTFYRRHEVQALVDRLCATLPDAAPEARGLIGLGAVISRCRARGMPDREAVLTAVLSGNIRPCALRKGVGLQRLMFDAASLGTFCDSRLGPTFGDSFPLQTAARMLGWHSSLLQRMVKHGLLHPCGANRNYGGAVLVSQAEIDRVRAEFVPPGEIGRDHGVRGAVVGLRLRAAGLRPVLDGTEDGETRWSAVYRRADLAGLDLAHIVTASARPSAASRGGADFREDGAQRREPCP